MIKETECAASAADRVFNQILEYLKPGLKEKEVAVRIRELIKKEGGERTPFRIIVASGVRSALPHGRASNKVIHRGELIIIDFGAIYKGFCSDITRTVVIGKPTRWQEKIYKAVREAQKKALAKVKGGVAAREVDRAARSFIEREGFGKFFKHGTGHGIGKRVHEKPRISKRSKEILKSGQVITIEPGIYVRGQGGVRIEDMVLVRERGYKLLTKTKRSLTL